MAHVIAMLTLVVSLAAPTIAVTADPADGPGNPACTLFPRLC